MDFLGLKTLTVIEYTRKILVQTRNLKFKIETIPLDDKKTFILLSEGDTVGVFQLESNGMRDVLQKMRTSKFEDLIAVLALYRPGPLGSGLVADFIERKLGKKAIKYLHPKLEPILKETYGIILYQEQTMHIVAQLAGFSLAQADLLRKAISKKIPEIMQEQRISFAKGCGLNHIPLETATKIFDLIEYFAGYGFNKSHSTAYALISYQTAYLKANFGVEFMAALLTSERTNTDKVVEYIHESKRMGIRILPPDINTSLASFTVTHEGDIRFGLLAVKNVGGAALENIVRVREEKAFKSFFDFCERVDSRVANKKVIESFIKCGVMDSLGLKRSQMAALLDEMLEKNTKKTKQDPRQMSFFDDLEPREPVAPLVKEWPEDMLLRFEKELLGIYVSSHPLMFYDNVIKWFNITKIDSLVKNEKAGDVMIAGVIGRIKRLTTKRTKAQMAILKVEDEETSIEVVVFPSVYEMCLPFLHNRILR